MNWMKTTAYLVGSLFLSTCIPHLCQFGEASVTKKVLESSTVNYTPTHIINSTASDGEFIYATTLLSKQNVSAAIHVRTTGMWNYSTQNANTVDFHQSSEVYEMFTTTQVSFITSSTESGSIKTSALTTHDNKRTSVFEVTGKQVHTTNTEYIRRNITELNSNSGNTYSTSLTTDTAITVKNDYVVTEAETVTTTHVSENTTIKMTVQKQSFIQEKISDILNDYISPVICVFGILCNIVNLIVLFDTVLSDSPYIYLTSLAITDMGVLVMVFIFHLFTRKSTNYAAVVFRTYVYFPVVNIFMDASIWVTCVLTLERIIYIKRPLLARSVCTRKKAKCFSSCIFLFDVLVNIPRFFVFSPFCSNGECFHQMTTFRQSEIFSYISWIYIAIINILPLIILLTSNLYMLKLLHISIQKRKRMQPHLVSQSGSNHSKGYQANKLTLTLIITVFLFIVCTFPSAFTELKVSHTLFGGNMNYTEFTRTDLYRILIDVSNILLVLNCSLNFFLYCVFNDKFRTVLRRKMASIVHKNSHNPEVFFLHRRS